MNLYLIQKYSDNPIKIINADPSKWTNLGQTEETIFFEPGEEADVLRGTCIMTGAPVLFLEIANRQFDLAHGERCYVLSHNEPRVARLHDTLRVVKLAYRSIFERTHESVQTT